MVIMVCVKFHTVYWSPNMEHHETNRMHYYRSAHLMYCFLSDEHFSFHNKFFLMWTNINSAKLEESKYSCLRSRGKQVYKFFLQVYYFFYICFFQFFLVTMGSLNYHFLYSFLGFNSPLIFRSFQLNLASIHVNHSLINVN